MENEQDLFLLLYVDDVLVLGSNGKEAKNVTEEISKSFKLRIDPKVTKFLGIVCDISDEEIILHSGPTVRRILKQFRMENCRSASTPFATGMVLDNKMCP